MSWRFVRVRADCPVSTPARARGATPALVLAGLSVLAAATAARAATTDIRTVRTQVFRAGTTPLTAAQVVPPSGAIASGVATFSLTSGGAGLHYEITHNVTGEISAHIHQAAQGVNGAVRHTLPLGSPKSGTFMMTLPDIAALSADLLYVDIHSAMFPGGAIRGQIRMQDLSCLNQPVEGQPVCLRVVVQNLGPDPYVGTEPPLGVRHMLPGPASAGRLRVTVDIDEPTKPGLGFPQTAFAISNDFVVTIAPGDSATLDFGQVAYAPPSGGLFEANTSSEAQAPNSDPNPSNDTIVTQFTVMPTTPAVRAGLLALLAAALGAVAARAVARRRAAAR